MTKTMINEIDSMTYADLVEIMQYARKRMFKQKMKDSVKTLYETFYDTVYEISDMARNDFGLSGITIRLRDTYTGATVDWIKDETVIDVVDNCDDIIFTVGKDDE